MILKLQKPLAGDLTQVLVYSQDKEVFLLLPYLKPLKRWFGDKEKKFVEGTIKKGTLTIEREIEDQNW